MYELLLAEAPSQTAAAEGCFTRAVVTARAQQSRAWELRATMSLAHLWRRQGRRDEARGALAAVYGSFTEGFTTPDLVDLLPAGHIPPGYLPILQAYDYAGDEVTLVHADDARLRRMAVFDVLINNADRKGGHILTGVDDGVYGVDHGVSLHVDDKLRTVLWGWAGKPVDDETLAQVDVLREALDGDLALQLNTHLTRREVDALRARTVALLENPVMPGPDRRRPIPWPAF